MLSCPSTQMPADPMLEIVVADYLQAEESGQPQSQQEWLARYPELAGDLKAFFDSRHEVPRLWPNRPLLPTPSQFGGYELLGPIARGGMGIVYKARHTRLNRVVALKLIVSGQLARRSDVERFHAEAEAAASLDHPNIVPIYEVGQHAGQHYFTMKLIDGGSLAETLTRRASEGDRIEREGEAPAEPSTPNRTSNIQNPNSAARLLATVARAVHYAHQRGILHRDLKPSNILLGVDEQPYVTDFGLAKRVEADDTLTGPGAIVGTPLYMAPEQAAGQKRLTTAADIYSLGAILYAMLTGRPAIQAATPLETLRQVQEQEPVSPRSLNPRIDRDLETICLKCLEKDPSRRYGSAEALAEDLDHWLAGEPIQARPVSRVERLWRWCRRNPAPAAASGLAVVAFAAVVALVVGSVFAIQLGEEQERTQAALQRAESQQEQTKAALQNAEAQKAVADEQRGRADEYLRQTERLATKMTMERGLALCEYENAARGMLWLARSLEKAPDHAADLQRAIRANLAGWQHQIHPLKAVLQHQERIVMRAAFSPDGKTIATRDGNGTTRLWEAATGKPVGVAMEHPGWGGWNGNVVFSPDSKILVTPGGASKTARLWDAATGQPIGEPLAHPNNVYVAIFSPDGKTLLTTSGDETGRTVYAHLWEVATGKPLGDHLQHQTGAAAPAFSPDGKTILIAAGNSVQLWDAATGKPLGDPISHSGNVGRVAHVAFSPDGKTFVTAGGSSTPGTGEARLWDAATGKSIGAPMRHERRISAVAFSPDGQIVLTGSADETARLWEASTGNPRGAPLQHQGQVWAVAFSPDSKTVVTGSFDRTARLWETATGKPIGAPLPHGGDVFTVAFSPDGKTILTASRESAARLWEVGTGKLPGTTLLHPRNVDKAVFSPDGKTVATASRDGAARLWEAATGKLRGTPLQCDAAVWTIAFSPDGKTLATGSGAGAGGGFARLWDVATGNPLGAPIEHKDAVRLVVFSPDGKTLATATRTTPSREAQLWDVATGQSVGAPLQNKRRLWALAFSPDSKTILTGSWGSADAAQLWDVSTGKPLGEPIPHPDGYVHVVAFSPDAKTILLAGGGTQLLEAATGKQLHSLDSLETGGLIVAAAFSPDGKSVVTGSQETKFARLWDVATGKPLG